MTIAHGEIPQQGSYAVYRCFDSGDYLLYVGISGDHRRRFDAHANTKDWWGRVARIELAWYRTRADAVLAESIAIATEDPHYNIAGRRIAWAG